MSATAAASTANTPSCRQAFSATLLSIARTDKNVFVVTSDARGSVTLDAFAKELPNQFVEVGIAEQNAAGIAAGLALSGKQVFLCGPACFYAARAVEQIKNDIAYANANVTVVGVSGGVSYGALGSTHHALHDIALYRAIPNMAVVLPADYQSTVAATQALAARRGPAYLRIGRAAVPDIYQSSEGLSIGVAKVLRLGSDCVVIASGEALFHASAAAEIAQRQGLSCTVVDVHTIKPLDTATILEVCRSATAVVTVEEHSVYGGLGGAVAELLASHSPRPMRILGFPDQFLPAGSPAQLFNYAGIEAQAIATVLIDLFNLVAGTRDRVGGTNSLVGGANSLARGAHSRPAVGGGLRG